VTVLSVEDLFTAGIGFDVVGAVLLGKGLLVSPKQQFRKGASGWGGYSFGQALSWAEDWVDASFGAAWLVVGFLLQAVGYAFVVGGVHVQHGAGEVGAAVGLLAAAVAVALGTWRAKRPSLIRARAVDLARVGSADGRPDAYLLAGMAHELGRTATSPSDVPAIVRDVFGVTDSVSRRPGDELERIIQSWNNPGAGGAG